MALLVDDQDRYRKPKSPFVSTCVNGSSSITHHVLRSLQNLFIVSCEMLQDADHFCQNLALVPNSS